jgi:hypothetical protein
MWVNLLTRLPERKETGNRQTRGSAYSEPVRADRGTENQRLAFCKLGANK